MSTYRFPPLTEFLINQIAFAMEDQNMLSSFDLKEGEVITDDERSFLDEEEREDPHRFIELPEWTSADGFRLMEEYAEGVRNDAIRKRLFFALNRGKGVFRAFKDVLAEEPALERKWYLFKEQELRKQVILWYQREAGAAELEALPPEDEELFEEILLEDFTFEACDLFDTEEIRQFIHTLLLEIGTFSGAGLLIERALQNTGRKLTHLARTATGELAGLIVYTLANDSTAEVLLYGINVRYRGLGLFRLLFDGFSRQLGRLRVNRIIFGVPEQNPKLKELFIRHGATPIATAYELTTHQWNTNHANSEQAFL
ncbi:MAG: hypothetical protein EWM48_10650 [Sphaerochaeta sp.]|nr:MAG: hypothetical protein EWM48_10650 [Sphaerochaeta sp.]